MALTFEGIIDWFMNGMNAIIDAVFFFVNPVLLKLFALSIFVICITKTHKAWLKWSIAILYSLYCILRITEIHDFVISMRWDQFFAIVPFLCMVLLPTIAKRTDWGQYLFNNYAMIVYYLIVNGIWLLIKPEDGQLAVVLMFTFCMFVIGQALEKIAGDQAQ